MEAELIIAKGLKFCVGRGYYTCIRMEMMKTIRGEWKIPWEKIEEIKEIASQVIIHIFREANQLADFIANIAIDQEGIQQFHSFIQLRSMEKTILNMDKSQLPTIRVRISNNHNSQT
ncbi:hypothetical protein KY284_001417 [Solanum tuberosum]|nr:hypothetical protein KY284_001417 [Solanum tuberosum]